MLESTCCLDHHVPVRSLLSHHPELSQARVLSAVLVTGDQPTTGVSASQEHEVSQLAIMAIRATSFVLRNSDERPLFCVHLFVLAQRTLPYLHLVCLSA